MADRTTLKGFFNTGDRPSESQFHAFIDSCVNLTVDPVNPLDRNSTIPAHGGIILGNTSVPDVPGAIKWDGTNFMIRTATAFEPLNPGAVTLGNPQNIGNVSIGSNLTGSIATFAHNTKYTPLEFAFGQSPTGITLVSSNTSIRFQNRTGAPNSPTITNVLTIQNGLATVDTQLTVVGISNLRGKVVIGNKPATPPTIPDPNPGAGTPAAPNDAILFVYGDGVKNQGGTGWGTLSDVRLKKDINQFSEGLDKLLKVNPVKFKYNGLAGTPNNSEEIGIIAQEINNYFPYMVSEIKLKMNPEDIEESPILTFNSSALQFVMINAFKEIHERLIQIEKIINKNN
jgi:hypothetical protein